MLTLHSVTQLTHVQAKECDQPRNPALMQCRNCDQMGHSSRECTAPKDWSKVKCNVSLLFQHLLIHCSELLNRTAVRWVTQSSAASSQSKKKKVVKIPGSAVMMAALVTMLAPDSTQVTTTGRLAVPLLSSLSAVVVTLGEFRAHHMTGEARSFLACALQHHAWRGTSFARASACDEKCEWALP